VCLNCAALTETLLESELFGHERGAFTGATERKIGKFEQAHGGTLMLDEIGEMSPSIQAKFLRVLEGHPFERVGGAASIRADVRVIAATNRDLEKDVAEKLFRRDLYFRLRVVEILVPPLRKRPEDIVELANYFLQKFVEETGRKIRGYAPHALEQMQRYRWPGNVRELKNVIHRALILAEQEIGPAHLAPELSGHGAAARLPSALTTLAEAERRLILAALEHFEGDRRKAAEALGVSLRTLYNRLREYAAE
jgi:Nif-specific regulatory protein